MPDDIASYFFLEASRNFRWHCIILFLRNSSSPMYHKVWYIWYVYHKYHKCGTKCGTILCFKYLMKIKNGRIVAAKFDDLSRGAPHAPQLASLTNLNPQSSLYHKVWYIYVCTTCTTNVVQVWYTKGASHVFWIILVLCTLCMYIVKEKQIYITKYLFIYLI